MSDVVNSSNCERDPWKELLQQKGRTRNKFDNRHARFRLEIYELDGRQRVGTLVDVASDLSDFAIRITLRMPSGTKTKLNGMQVGGELQWVRNEKSRTFRFVLKRYV